MATRTRASEPQFRHIAPFFVVDDVVTSAEYYRDALGFTFDRYWGDPPCFAIMQRDGVFLMLQEKTSQGRAEPNHERSGDDETWDAYVWMEGVDAYFEQIKAKDVKVLAEPYDTLYDNREILVEDCDGYLICFGEHIAKDADAD